LALWQRGQSAGLSDIDIFILADAPEVNPIERARLYFGFFSDKIEIGIDVLVATKDDIENFEHLLQGSLILYIRDSRNTSLKKYNRSDTLKTKEQTHWGNI
jgi:hypothetical protein